MISRTPRIERKRVFNQTNTGGLRDTHQFIQSQYADELARLDGELVATEFEILRARNLNLHKSPDRETAESELDKKAHNIAKRILVLTREMALHRTTFEDRDQGMSDTDEKHVPVAKRR